MLFNSFQFLAFFAVVLVLYYVLPHKYRWLFLLLTSYYFYSCGEPYFIGLLIISTLVDFYCALKIGKSTDPKTKKFFLWTSILINLGILIGFKYLFFFLDSFNGILHQFGVEVQGAEKIEGYRLDQILLPIGISFYTFQSMSYTIDVYRGLVKPERHLGHFALYVAFFPQLVAGPIERASRLLPQFKKIAFPEVQQIRRGLVLIAWGFFLKLVVADRLGIYVDSAYSDIEGNRGLPLILAALFFGFQIYFDFAAYTYIALGAARTMGITLINNFNRPMFSHSIAQFWQRWHISLTQWIRDYLYRSLRKGTKMGRVPSVVLVFLIMGLWHGANWTFVVWGLLNAIFLIVEIATNPFRARFFRALGIPSRVVHFFGVLTTFSLVVMSLVFFRSSSIMEAIQYIKNIFPLPNLHINILDNYFELLLAFLLIIGVQLVHYYKGNNRIHELIEGIPTWRRWTIYAVYLVVIVLFGLNRQQSFIYFQF